MIFDFFEDYNRFAKNIYLPILKTKEEYTLPKKKSTSAADTPNQSASPPSYIDDLIKTSYNALCVAGKMISDEDQTYLHTYADKASGEAMEVRLNAKNTHSYKEAVSAFDTLLDCLFRLYALKNDDGTDNCHDNISIRFEGDAQKWGI